MDKHTGGPKTRLTPARSSRSGTASPFVGRDGELRRLAAALDLAAEGQGGAIFLTGQPGIGKTRLAREALALAGGRGFTTLEGRAHSPEASLAYAPFLDAFGPLLRSLDPTHLATLVCDLPDLGRLFGGLNLLPPEPLGDAALEKTRLFEAVSRFLDRLIKEAPVALFIDDVHWADPATLEMLHYLARGLSDQRALFLATCSDDILNSSPSLQELLGSLQRYGMAEEVIISRLEPDEVDELARGILGGQAPGDLLALLEARAGGTPLFVEALIAALIESGSLVRTPSEKDGWTLDAKEAVALPPSVRRLILGRLARLAPGERHILDLIAVMGDATSHTLLRAASGMEDDTLLDVLRRLRASGLVADGMDGADIAYSLTHPLIQEVAYAELPVMERRRAHLKAVEALESLSEMLPEDLNRLARQYRGAGPNADPDRALAALIAAGDQALGLYANEEAARHYQAALAIVRRRRKATVLAGFDETLLPQLPERLGEALHRTGDHRTAVAMWNEALGERELTGDVVAASRLRGSLALAELDQGHFDIAEKHLCAGLAAMTGHEPCKELADLHLVRFSIASRLRDMASLADTAAEFLSLADRLALPRVETEANCVATQSDLWQRNVTGAREHALRALAAAERGEDVALFCLVYLINVNVNMYVGDHRLISQFSNQGLAVAQRVGEPSSEVFFRSHLALANFMSGAWDESRRASMAAFTLARRIGIPRSLAYALAERAITLAFQGDLPGAEACIGKARAVCDSESSADRYVFGLVDIAEATLTLERGHVERALAITRSFDSELATGRAFAGLAPPHLPVGLMLLAEAQVAAGEPAGAMETARHLVGLSQTDTPYLSALASRAEGLALQALGQGDRAMACLSRAAETFTSLEMPFEAARSLLEQAEVAANRQPEVALAAARQSLTIFERLRAPRYVDRARRMLRGLGFSPLAMRSLRLNSGPLSERKLEIARLVAEGLTTPEIARRLIISRRTVSTHLSQIYACLGLGSRSALARYVTEAGLVSSVKIRN